MRFATQAAIVVTLAAAPAAHAGYTLTPVKIHGKPAVSVDVISAAGVLGGTYVNADGVQLGYLLSGGMLTTLKPDPPYLGNPRPTGINDKGVVAGFLSSGSQIYGFTWKKGHYKQLWLIDGGNGTGPELNSVSINSGGSVAFDSYDGDGAYSLYFGKQSPFQKIPLSLSLVNTINRAGVTAGNNVGLAYPQTSIFTCTSTGAITAIQGPGDTSADYGFINDSGAIAGTYYGSGPASGFVLKNGKYKIFNAPVPVKDMIVQAFSNTGIVAGTYTDVAGASHGFAWNGKIFSDVVPNPSANETVTVVGVSDAGDVALDLRNTTTGAYVPYVAHCQGNGC